MCAATGRSLEGGVNRTAAAAPASSGFEGMVLDGKYQLIRQIGAGGVGRVFEAQNLALGKKVAVKLILDRAATAQIIVRLEREAAIVAGLHHPNICQAYDMGRLPGGAPFVVFERLFGETLADRTHGVLQLPVRAALDLFAQLLSGLEAAHSARIVHRDLKPQNIFLVDRSGEEPLVKLLDFGFARDLAVSTRITRPGDACGTLQYMSPEQLRCDPVDARSDLFAIGVMLYEVLAGRHPFAATSRFELQANILRAVPLPLRVRRTDVPAELEELITWCLSRTPAERPASALELQRALLSVARSASLPAFGDEEPVSVTEPVWLAPTSTPAT